LSVATFLSPVVFGVDSLEVKSSIATAIQNIKTEDNHWFRYQVKMEPNNGMPCCYHSRNKSYCELEGKNYGWSSSGSSGSQDSKTLDIYFKSENSRIQKILFAGSECNVNAERAYVTELTGVSNNKSLSFLNQQLSQVKSRHSQQSIVSSIALHEGEQAQEVIEALVDNNRHVENAIFWLGAARNEAGYKALVKLLDDDKQTRKHKKRAIFALSENSSKKAFPKLMELAKNSNDENIRGESLFWLAQNNVAAAFPVIEKVLEGTPSRRMTEKAVFALSQYEGKRSWDLLVELAINHQSLNVREKAIFWLSQSEKRAKSNEYDSLPVLLKLATGAEPRKISEQAVFAISQLKGEKSVNGLVSLIKNSKDKSVKKKAIFWLGQSNHPKALDYIEGLLVSAN